MILITGATGFIGGHLVSHLLTRERSLRALVRPGGVHRFLTDRGVEVVPGDVTDPASLPAALDGVDQVIHLVGLIAEPPGVSFEAVVAEGTRSLVAAAEAAGIRRFVYLSAAGTSPTAASRYYRTKAVAEAAVRDASCEHVIVRPSVVYGPGDAFVNLFANAPIPLIDGGRNLLQPVYVGDLMKLLDAVIDRSDAANQTYELGGPEQLTLQQMVTVINRVTGRWMPHPPLPSGLAWAQAWLFDTLKKPLYAVGIKPPLTRDNLLMLATDNVCDNGPVSKQFGLTLTGFEDGLRTWLGRRS